MSLNLILQINIIILVFLPSFVYIVFSMPSLTYGLVLAISIQMPILLFLASKSKKLIFSKKNILSLLFFELMLVLYLFQGSQVAFFKIIGSFFIFNILIAYAFFLRLLFNFMSNEKLVKVFSRIFYLLTVCGFSSFIFKIEYFGYQNYPKSIFTFYEPSHYILVLCPFAFVTYFTSKIKIQRVFILIAILIFGLYFPSLIALVLFLMMLISTFDFKKFFILLLVLFSSFFYFNEHSETEYFSSRLNISENSNNLSALVYYQGVNDAYRALVDTSGIGLGYQMAGTNELSSINNRIYKLAGMYMNLNDGSFTSSKLIQEFGVFGLMLVFLYIVFFVQCQLAVREKFFKFNSTIVNSALIISFVVEMFFRSSGYFTIGSILLIVAMLGRRKKYEYNKNSFV